MQRHPRREGGNAPELLVGATAKVVERLGAAIELRMVGSTLGAGGSCIPMPKGFSIAGTKLFRSLGEPVGGWRLVGV